MDSRPSPATLIRGFPNCKTRHPAGLFLCISKRNMSYLCHYYFDKHHPGANIKYMKGISCYDRTNANG